MSQHGDKRYAGDTSTARKKLQHVEYTVGWVCAVPVELAAAKAVLDELHEDLPNEHGNPYTLGRIGNHNIVITCLSKYGTTTAAVNASQLQSIFPSVQFILMVGIGGGAPNDKNDIRLGDVVVSTPTDRFGGVLQYDFGKTIKDGHFHLTGHSNKPPRQLLEAVNHIRADHLVRNKKFLIYLSQIDNPWCTYPGQHQDQLFQPEYEHVGSNDTCDHCEKTKQVLRAPRVPDDRKIHYGLVATANQVMKDGETRDRLAKEYGILCFEMEAAGLMDHFNCLVIRGICDYSDSHKNKQWQGYAAAVAAAYAKELIETIPPIRSQEPVNKEYILKVTDWLTPRNYSTQQLDFIQRRAKGTSSWLLESSEYKSWLEGSSNSQTLFCAGIPGAGKTIMSSIVIKDLHDTFMDDSQTGIACLFCNYKNREQQSASELLAGLLKQLVLSLPAIPTAIEKLYTTHSGKRTRPTLDDLSNALQSTAKSDFSRGLYFVIDALDECDDSNRSREFLLSTIFSLQEQAKSTRISLFATSRFIPEIQEKFNGSLFLEIRASKNDIEEYINGRITQCGRIVRKDNDLYEAIKNQIVQAADGMFLLAELYMDSLIHKRTKNQIKAALEEFGDKHTSKASKLDDAFDQAMKRIDEQPSDLPKLAKLALSWVSCTMRLLTTSEFLYALAVRVNALEYDEGDQLDIEDVVSFCAGLITVDKESDIVRLVHYTAQGYFQRRRGEIFPNAHSNITEVCVVRLSLVAIDTTVFYSYAAKYWIDHFDKAGLKKDELCLDSPVHKLLQCFLIEEAGKTQNIQGMFERWKEQQITRVHIAAFFGIEEIIKKLHDSGHDLDCKDKYHRTPLMFAAKRGHRAAMRLLLDYGTKVDSKDILGRTSLSIAVHNRNIGIIEEVLAENIQINFSYLKWEAENYLVS